MVTSRPRLLPRTMSVPVIVPQLRSILIIISLWCPQRPYESWGLGRILSSCWCPGSMVPQSHPDLSAQSYIQLRTRMSTRLSCCLRLYLGPWTNCSCLPLNSVVQDTTRVHTEAQDMVQSLWLGESQGDHARAGTIADMGVLCYQPGQGCHLGPGFCSGLCLSLWPCSSQGLD